MEVKVGQIYLDSTADMMVRFVSEIYAIVEYYGGEVEKRSLVDFIDFELMKDVDSKLSDLEIVQKALEKSRMDLCCKQGKMYLYNDVGEPAIHIFESATNMLTWAKQTVGYDRCPSHESEQGGVQ